MLDYFINLFRKKGPSLTLTFIKDPEPGGGYIVFFNEYPVVTGQGKTKKEALKNLNEDFVETLKMQVPWKSPNGAERYIIRLWVRKIANMKVSHEFSHIQLATIVGEATALIENERV